MNQCIKRVFCQKLYVSNIPFLIEEAKRRPEGRLLCAHCVIFPGRRQPSIVTVNELNYCVRNGNRCTLITINTHFIYRFRSKLTISFPLTSVKKNFGDPWENRTPVCGVRGRRLNRLTNGPLLPSRVAALGKCGAPSGTRTQDPLIKSQLLYQLS